MAFKIKNIGNVFASGPSDLEQRNLTFPAFMKSIKLINSEFEPFSPSVDIQRKPAWDVDLKWEPDPKPKLKLRESVPMTDEFRAEMNQWLLNMFGRKSKDDERMRLLITQTIGWGPIIKPEFAAASLTVA